MNPHWPWTHLKKMTKGKNVRKKREGRKKKKKKKKKKEKKGDFIYESSLGEIRLTTSPCIRSRHAPSKIVLDRVRKTYKLSTSNSLDLNVKKLLI